MKSLIACFAFAGSVLSTADAQTDGAEKNPFSIRSIKRETKAQAYVEKAWQRNVPCIEVSIRVEEDMDDKKPFVKAYFFGRDNKLLAKLGEPSLVTAPKGGTVRVPEYLKPGERIDVWFAIPARHLSGREKWHRVVVVFGHGDRAVADIFPPGDLADYEFEEKSFAVSKR